jgi:hypothetical protein
MLEKNIQYVILLNVYIEYLDYSGTFNRIFIQGPHEQIIDF